MTYSVGTGTSGIVTDIGIGQQLERAHLFFDFGASDSDHDNSIHLLYAQLLVGAWVTSGRFAVIPSLGVGAAKREAGREILRTTHLNWTARADVRVALLARLLRTSYAQPSGRVVNVGVGIEGQTFVTADREAAVAITVNLRLWRSTAP